MAKYGSRRSQQPENVNLKSFTILNKLSSTRSSASTSATSRSFEVASSKARVTSVKSSVQSFRTYQETSRFFRGESVNKILFLTKKLTISIA